jgi:hypothetical protein
MTALLLGGCSTLERKAAVRSSDLSRAQVAGLQSSRYLIATTAGINNFVDDVNKMNQQLGKKAIDSKSNYLSLSGGGITALLVQVYWLAGPNKGVAQSSIWSLELVLVL